MATEQRPDNDRTAAPGRPAAKAVPPAAAAQPERHRQPRRWTRRGLVVAGGLAVAGLGASFGRDGWDATWAYFMDQPTEYPVEWRATDLDIGVLPHFAYRRFEGATGDRSTWGAAIIGMRPTELGQLRDKYGETAQPAVVFGRGTETKIAQLGTFAALTAIGEQAKETDALAVAVELGNGDLEVSLGVTHGSDPHTYASSAEGLRGGVVLSQHDLARHMPQVNLLTTAS
jgi:hypothetical protein